MFACNLTGRRCTDYCWLVASSAQCRPKSEREDREEGMLGLPPEFGGYIMPPTIDFPQLGVFHRGRGWLPATRAIPCVVLATKSRNGGRGVCLLQ